MNNFGNQCIIKAIDINNPAKLYSLDIRAVDNITFYVDEGEIIGLLGPNGADKTTALKAIATLGRHTSGSITAFLEDIRSENAISIVELDEVHTYIGNK